MEPQLKLREGATAWQGVEDEAVLLDVERASWVGVNRSGTLLWSMLAGGTSRTAMVDALCEHWSVPREQAEHDVDAFVAECTTRGYLA
jgi:hypothetical protein